jgi:hypothetical protein
MSVMTCCHRWSLLMTILGSCAAVAAGESSARGAPPPAAAEGIGGAAQAPAVPTSSPPVAGEVPPSDYDSPPAPVPTPVAGPPVAGSGAAPAATEPGPLASAADGFSFETEAAMPAGVTLLVTGVATLVPGFVFFAIGDKEQDAPWCTPGSPQWGNCPQKEEFVAKQLGSTLIAGGTASILLGVSTWATSAVADARPASNLPMETAGMVLTGFGSSALVAGTASSWLLADSDAGKDDMPAGMIIAAGGLAVLAVGLPLWLVAGSSDDESSDTQSSGADQANSTQLVYRSPAMMAGGITLLAMGVTGAVGAAVLGLTAGSHKAEYEGDDMQGQLTVAAGFTVPAAAMLITAGGLLVGIGAAKVPPTVAAPAKAGGVKRDLAPAVRLGPGAGSLSWRF